MAAARPLGSLAAVAHVLRDMVEEAAELFPCDVDGILLYLLFTSSQDRDLIVS